MPGKMCRISRVAAPVALAFSLAWLCACKPSADAKATAQQMQAVAQDMTGYYATLVQTSHDTESLEQIQSVLLGIPVGTQDIQQIQTTQIEMQKRLDMAKSLQSLAAAFANLGGPATSADVSASANRLASEMVSLQVVPSGPPIPAALGKAASFLIRAFQKHDEKKIAASLAPTLDGISKLFAEEKPAYEALYATSTALAASLASLSVQKGWVDEGLLLKPALQPFGLQPLQPAPPGSLTDLQQEAQRRITLGVARRTEEQKQASDGLQQALLTMAKRMHELAAGHPMQERGNPSTLADVEAWLSQLGLQ